MGEDGVLIHLWFPNEFLFKHGVGFLHFPHPSRASNVPKWVTLFTEIISSLDAHKWVTLFYINNFFVSTQNEGTLDNFSLDEKISL